MFEAIGEFLFGAEAAALNTALGIIASALAIVLFGWGILKGTARLVRKEPEPKPIAVRIHEEPEPEPIKETRSASGYFINVPAGRAVIGRGYELASLRLKLKEAADVVLTNSGAILSGQGGGSARRRWRWPMQRNTPSSTTACCGWRRRRGPG